ncbi:hypothetical protein Fmac_021506 [Flemingia macrophylla]|uniref:Small auxin up regulated protein n=1 Tax=Flemingia macrophylla TaxID=520843 RepID=A0ABD1LX33_9FABA
MVASCVTIMGRIASDWLIKSEKDVLWRASFTALKSAQAPKGCIAVYVGETQKRFVIPISYLNQPSFQELLCQVEEEYGYDHPMGGLKILCSEDVFQHMTSRLSGQ